MGRAIVLAAAVLAVAVSGCGDDEGSGEQRPQLPRDLATALAAESEIIAQSLDAGQDCAALRQAEALQGQIGDAVSRGEVPPQLGTEMSEAAQALVDGIECAPTPTVPTEPTTTAPTSCESLEAQIDQLKLQAEQTKDESSGPGSEELKKQFEDQAKALENQLKEQCEEGGGEGDGGEGDGGDGGPGNSGNGRGRGSGRGNGGGDGGSGGE